MAIPPEPYTLTAAACYARRMNTGFLYDPACLAHDTGQGHPERPARLSTAMAYLQAQPWFGDLHRVSGRPAGREWIEAVHQPDYIDRVAAACRRGERVIDSPDVAVSEQSHDLALLACGGALALADQVAGGEVDNAFAMMRPPGHHAERATAMGFCLYNNVAVAARYLQRKHGLDKILILDWDVHHGNGTQHAFSEDPSVFYASLHQYPYYPGTGAASEEGEGRGRGATLNCPMAAGATDADYELAFREVVLPAMDKFAPQMILLSAGFDAHRDDPLAAVELSTGFFHWMTVRVMECADKHCGGKILSLLEGGYSLTALPLCIGAHLQTLSGVKR